MLETVRALVESDCMLTHSVIFVAFDKEEVGSQGSHEFVRSYLVPRFFKGQGSPRLQGAIILDTILNFNDTENSQTVVDDWQDKVAEDVTTDIELNGNRGDFIAAISRHGVDDQLVNMLHKHWNKLHADKEYMREVVSNPEKYRMKKLETVLPPSLPPLDYLANFTHFIRSDHVRFWYSNEFNFQGSFQSVLLTDTGPYRGMMRRCYHRECDTTRGQALDEGIDLNFLAHTTQTVIHTVMEMSQAKCELSIRW